MRKVTNRGKKFPLKTERQRLALTIFTKRLASGKPFTLQDVLLSAGFAPESVRQYSNVMQSLQPHFEPIVDEMEAHRQEIMERMRSDQVLATADYADHVKALDILTKNIRLLTGRSTQNLAISKDRRAELDRLLDL